MLWSDGHQQKPLYFHWFVWEWREKKCLEVKRRRKPVPRLMVDQVGWGRVGRKKPPPKWGLVFFVCFILFWLLYFSWMKKMKGMFWQMLRMGKIWLQFLRNIRKLWDLEKMGDLVRLRSTQRCLDKCPYDDGSPVTSDKNWINRAAANGRIKTVVLLGSWK